LLVTADARRAMLLLPEAPLPLHRS